MSTRINTNVASLMAVRHLSSSNRALDENNAKMASGQRIVKASDDAAGLSISAVMKANIKGKRQAIRNSNDAVSIVQIAEGNLNELSNMATRMRELAIAAASDTYGDSEREFLDMEVQQLKAEIDRIAESAKWNGNTLLDGNTKVYDIQVDSGNGGKNRIQIKTEDLAQTTHALGLYDVRVNSRLQSKFALAKIDYAINEISKSRATLGSYQSRFESATRNLTTSDVNLSAANSRIRDADYAKLSSKNASDLIRKEAATNVLKTSNFMSNNVLKLVE